VSDGDDKELESIYKEVHAIVKHEYSRTLELATAVTLVAEPKTISQILDILREFSPLVDAESHLARVNKKDGTHLLLLCTDICSGDVESRGRQVLQQLNASIDGGVGLSLVVVRVSRFCAWTAEQWREWRTFWPISNPRAQPVPMFERSDRHVQSALRAMQRCAELAADAERRGEARPNGAVFVRRSTGETVGEASCCVNGHPLDHAVMRAIADVAQTNDPAEQYICTQLDVYVLVEPCVMCSMALVHSRCDRVIFSLRDPKFGALASNYRLHTVDALNHHYEVFEGLNRSINATRFGMRA
jgi:tRNA-specific adenosine deaminase 3